MSLPINRRIASLQDVAFAPLSICAILAQRLNSLLGQSHHDGPFIRKVVVDEAWGQLGGGRNLTRIQRIEAGFGKESGGHRENRGDPLSGPLLPGNGARRQRTVRSRLFLEVFVIV